MNLVMNKKVMNGKKKKDSGIHRLVQIRLEETGLN